MRMKMNLRVSLIVVLCCSICASEPECSKFHYEEKTLEKMIKTEIFVQNMKSEIDEKEQKMQDVLEKIQEDWKTTKSELVAVKDRHEQTMQEVLEKIHEDWKTTKSELVAVKDRHEESITEYKAEFDKIRDDAVVPVTAFQAHELQNTSPNSNEALIFTATDFDSDSAYNNKTGVYTTAVSGVYLFTCQLCIRRNQYLYVELVSDKTSVVRMFMDGGKNGPCRRMTGMIIVEAGEQVWIKAGTSPSGADLWQDTISWNSFSGVLINTPN